MANETIELLFRFITQGQADVDKAAAGVEKLVSGAKAGSAPVDALAKSVGGIKQQADAAGKSLTSLAGSASQAGSAAASAGNGFGSLFGIVSRGGAIIGGVAAGLGVVGKAALDLVTQAGQAAEATLNLAQRLDLSVGATERLQAQAKIAGVSLSTLEGASRTLSAALQDPGGQGLRASQALQKLGISAVTTTGQLREPGPVLLDLLRRLSEVSSASERLFLAQKVLPEDAAKNLLPLVNRYKELGGVVDALGVGLDENLTKNLAKADDEIDKLTIAWEKFKKSLAGEIAPVVIPVVTFATEVLAGPRGAIKVDPNNPNSLRDQLTNYRNGTPPTDLASRFVDFATGQDRERAAAAFRERQGNTESGIRNRLAEIDRQLNETVRILGSSVDETTRKANDAKLAQLTTEKSTLTSRLEALRRRPDAEGIQLAVERAIEGFTRKQVDPVDRFNQDLAVKLDGLRKQGASGADLERVRAAAEPERRQILETQLAGMSAARLRQITGGLLAPGIEGFQSTFVGSFLSPTSDRSGDGSAADQAAQTKAWLEGEKARQELAKKGREVEIEAAVRLIELSDNEYDSARRIRDIRVATAETELDFRKANLDYTVRIAEIDKNRLEQYKQTAAGVYRSIRQRGGGGLRDLLIGQLDIQGEKIFANASASLFQSAGGALGRLGAAIPGAGTLLKGTLFDPANAQRPVEKNTASLDRLTRSVDGLNRRMGGQAGGILDVTAGLPGGATLSDVATFASDLNGITGQGGSKSGGVLGKVFGGTSGGSNTASFMGGLGSVFGGGLFRGIGGDFSVQTGDGTATTAGTAGRIGNVIGSAALVAAGAAGFVSGVREGGARGALGAASSALGIAAAIPGPQQPFIAGAAALAGIVRTLIPNPKEVFGKEQDATLNSRRYEGPAVMDRSGDFAGGGDSVDYDWRGRTRIVNRTLQVQINALDARSIMDRKDDLADAVGRAFDDGHPAGASVQKLVFGPDGS